MATKFVRNKGSFKAPDNTRKIKKALHRGTRPRRHVNSFLLTLGDRLRPLLDAAEIEGEACRLLAAHLDVDRAHYAEIHEAIGRVTVVRDAMRDGVTSMAGTYTLDDFTWALPNLRRGLCNVVQNSQNSSLVPAHQRVPCKSMKFIALIAAPVLKEGRLVGALVVTDSTPRSWAPGDVRVVQEVAERLWATLLRARAEAALLQRTAAVERQAVQLRRLASELTLAEHRTRELLSRTLHDGLQQQLYCAVMLLDGGMALAGGGNEPLARARAELSAAIEQTRCLSMDLFPPVLHNEGLPDALDWLVSWGQKNYGLRVLVLADPKADPELLETRILLFESVRELIFNAVKHARVQEVRVELTRIHPEEIQVVVADNGVGFNPEQVLQGGISEPGLGLFSIRERLAMLGGAMEMDSAPGQGARFTVRAPFKAPEHPLA